MRALTNREKHITKLNAVDLGIAPATIKAVKRVDEFTAEYTVTLPGSGEELAVVVQDFGGIFTVSF